MDKTYVIYKYMLTFFNSTEIILNRNQLTKLSHITHCIVIILITTFASFIAMKSESIESYSNIYNLFIYTDSIYLIKIYTNISL